MKQHAAWIGIVAIVAVGVAPAAWTQPPPPERPLRVIEALDAELPQSPPCKITVAEFSFAGRPQAPGQTTFQGRIQNRSLAPVEVSIRVGYKEAYNVLMNRDVWFTTNLRKAEIPVSRREFDFQISVGSPPDVLRAVEQGQIFPIIEIREAASGALLDATTPFTTARTQRISEFDPAVLSGDHVERVAGYEIVWSATLAALGSNDPAIFYGQIRNPKGKSESVVLRAGFMDVLGGQNARSEDWRREARATIALASNVEEVPFEVKVECAPGIYVGLDRGVYQAKVWLLTEAVQEAIRRREQEARRSRSISPEHILVNSGLSGIVVREATYAYTVPGKPGNAGRFAFTVENRSEQPRRFVARYGFLSIQPSDPWNRRTWHFVQEQPLILESAESKAIRGDAACHVHMEDLVDGGSYAAYILIEPVTRP